MGDGRGQGMMLGPLFPPPNVGFLGPRHPLLVRGRGGEGGVGNGGVALSDFLVGEGEVLFCALWESLGHAEPP